MEIVRLENVLKYYGTGNAVTRAVDGISLEVESGEFVTIMGASGSGKTTLLNLIATIDSVTAGNIIVDGQNITYMREKELALLRAKKLGFVFQEYNLLDTLTVYENITLPLSLQGVATQEVTSRADRVVEKFGLQSIVSKFPVDISGGERQRTACARALVTNPALILADEPTGALDSKNSKNLMRLLRTMNREDGATILTVTHDPVVASYADRVLFLKDGKLHNEIVKGEKTDPEFLREILDINAAAGGEQYAG